MSGSLFSLDIKVAWSIAAWEMCLDRRDDLGTPERHILLREIKTLEKFIPEIGFRLTSAHHLCVARPLLQVGLAHYQKQKSGLIGIFAPILSDSLDSYLLEQGYNPELMTFKYSREDTTQTPQSPFAHDQE